MEISGDQERASRDRTEGRVKNESNNSRREQNDRSCGKCFGWILIALILILLCIVVVIFTPKVIKQMAPFFDWIKQNIILGYIIYFVVYILSIPLFVPSLLFVLAASLSFS